MHWYPQNKFNVIVFRELKNISKTIIVLLFVFICIDNTYSYPDSSNFKSQLHITKNKDVSLPVITLKEGIAFVKGQIPGYDPASGRNVRISYLNPIMDKSETFDAKISESGDFFINVPMLSNSTCLFISDYYKEYILLSPGDTINITINAEKVKERNKFDTIRRDSLDKQYVCFEGAFAKVNNELNCIRFWSKSMILFRNKNKYQNPSQYKKEILSTLETSLKVFLNKNISEQTKELITINLQQTAIRSLMDYNTLVGNHSKKGDLSTPAVNIGYFSFLKEMNFNSRYSFYGRFFSNIISECQRIEDMLMPLEKLVDKRKKPQKELVFEDIKRQKDNLAMILNENNGPAFDMLEALNFSSIINQDMTLKKWETDRLEQLKEPVYYDYLTGKNEKLSSHLKEVNKTSTSVIYDISTKSKDNYFEDIISLNKGKIILVNYWSPGCRFALDAIKIIEPLKIKYTNSEVVFLYLTEDYFLHTSWENKAKQIEGIHYRLNEKQLNYIISNYKMENSTPGFLLFNKKGKCIFNHNGYSEKTIKNIFNKIDKEF